MRLSVLVTLMYVGVAHGAAGGPPLQTWTVRDHLNHRWVDELVHFEFAVATQAKDLVLTDAGGTPVPCQFTDIRRDQTRARTTGKVWTVVTVEPNGRAMFELRPGKPTALTALTVKRHRDRLVLSNSSLAITLANWSEGGPQGKRLTSLSAPVLSVCVRGGKPLGSGAWVNAGPGLTVKRATTAIVEQGPVRIVVRQHLTFTDGHTYEATITLAARQEAALVTEHCTVDAPKAAFRFSVQPGLEANRVFWHNQWRKTANAGTWAKVLTKVTFDKPKALCQLRPWSFWWYGDITEWAGFYRQGGEHLVGVLALRPSRWSPPGWDGFDRTRIPVTQGPDRRLDLTFALLATKRKAKDGVEQLVPLHREWAVTVGRVSDHVDEARMAKRDQAAKLKGAARYKMLTDAKWTSKLRRQLIKYSEFPLDEVKDYGFEFTPAKAGRTHPFLLFTRADVKRVRRQAKRAPSVKAYVQAARDYIVKACHAPRTFEKEGWQAFYRKNYWGNYLVEKLPEAYIGSDDPIYGRLMGAAVKGLTQTTLDTFLEKPSRPAIGAYGPWFSDAVMRLLFNYDLIAGTGLLTEKEEAAARSALVFGAHFLAHPDYWNPAHGLASANPNMTSSIRLPKGLAALFLGGHPTAQQWLEGAEAELRHELKHWIKPGGAWIENPGYQAASLDGMLILAQAIKNVTGRDHFSDPQFRATMDYYGFILTPPDVRFPPKRKGRKGQGDVGPPMVQPSIGDMFAGFITCFNGWMAASTAQSDPAYSARQQFYWKAQNAYLGSAGRAKGMSLCLTDPDLPLTPPQELDRAFPGFGSILRSSWTDPRASYVAHRTGPNVHHYHDEYNSIVYYAKGAPLCTDFGNCYSPVHRKEARYHSRVSFDRGGSTGELVDVRGLRSFAACSHGRSQGGTGQKSDRHVLLVKSADPLGATYVVIRDKTTGGRPDQAFSWNLWCLSEKPTVADGVVHFPGQFGVDLDVHLLSPAGRDIQQDHWAWKQHIYVWGPFREAQHGVHVTKKGPKQDYLSVLYPRARGQASAEVTSLADDAAIKVVHVEGTDVVLLSPGKAAEVSTGDVYLKGETALARRYGNGTTRLAVLKGAACTAGVGEWRVTSDSPVGIEVKGKRVTGESDGPSHTATIRLPPGYGPCTLVVDGRAMALKREGRSIRVELPAGYHAFGLKPR